MISFKLPEDYIPPEGTEIGKAFQDIATFIIDEDNKITIRSIGRNENSVGPKGGLAAIEEELNNLEEE